MSRLLGMEYNFPQELVENILTRLPLRSLLRFKCLSKQWYLAFSDSKKFITGQDFFLHYIDYHTPGLSRLRIPTSFDGSEGNTVEAVDVECPLAGTSNEEIICVAHCNGILCMLNHTYSQPEHYASTVIVWNPMTRERKRFQLTGGEGGRRGWEAFGFSYDASIEDYKIMHMYYNVHIIDFQTALDVYQCRSINVLRMKTGQWNIDRNNLLDGICDISEKNRVGTAVNGCLYWIARKGNGSVIEFGKIHFVCYAILIAFILICG
ncbi:hypothetical protein SLEP1_g2434 [Rubroshorea leprosula]|uniref:F-box domain-containing protein n=1 Tax=Rubroshorea leprosula TaxID=152421 RepID=A0AAV5HH65_9ROSI|nr:hypothetical protein SLEP1_g2434 [Rubroshorea leprosula]